MVDGEMSKKTTLSELLKRHPEWADLPIVIYTEDEEYHFVGCSGSVYEDEDEDEKILVFSGN